MRIDKTKPIRTQSHPLILGICLIALVGLHCGEDKDPAYSRGSTVTALSDMDEWVLSPAASSFPQFLVFLSEPSSRTGASRG